MSEPSKLFDDQDTGPHAARRGVERAALDVLRVQHGPGAVVERPLAPGYRTGFPAPADYRLGVAAARLIANHARAQVIEYARTARGHGVSWADLAEPLDVEPAEWVSPGEAAFEYVASTPRLPHDAPVAHWRCQSCNGYVADSGPYNGHPTDCERGHAEGCQRHADEIAAYEHWRDFD